MAMAESENPRHNACRIVNRIVSDRDETNPFYVDPNTTMSSIMPRPGAVIHVQSMRLDDLHDPELKTFVKMDIEGAEYRALAGAPKFLDLPKLDVSGRSPSVGRSGAAQVSVTRCGLDAAARLWDAEGRSPGISWDRTTSSPVRHRLDVWRRMCITCLCCSRRSWYIGGSRSSASR